MAMADSGAGAFSVALLADRIHLVPAVAEMRWKEWGHAPEPEDLSWWADATRREADREELPVTFVATDKAGEVAAAVGLGRFDIDKRRDRPPRPSRHRCWPARLDAPGGLGDQARLWPTETLHRGSAGPATVLTKLLSPTGS